MLQNVRYEIINHKYEREARELLKSTVDAVRNPNYLDNPPEKQLIEDCRLFYEKFDLNLPRLYDEFIGAYIDGKMVGAIHVTSYLSQFPFKKYLELSMRLSEEEARYNIEIISEEHRNAVTKGLFIEEIGVLSEFRREGIGRGLLLALEQQIMNPNGITRLVAAATSEASFEFFSNVGFLDFGHILPSGYFGDKGDLELNVSNMADSVKQVRWFGKKQGGYRNHRYKGGLPSLLSRIYMKFI